MSARLKVNSATLRSAMRRLGVHPTEVRQRFIPPLAESGGVSEHEDGSATITSDPATQPKAPWKPEELLEAHGLDPNDWEILRVRSNRWGDPADPRHQLRVDVVPHKLLLVIPDPGEWKVPKLKRRKTASPEHVVVISDHHAPHHDKVFHGLFLAYLAEHQPDLIEVNGDLMDFATISRFREREGFAQPANECLLGGFTILRDYREVCPNARIRLKRGNHDERLVYAIVDNVRELHKLRPADEEIPALDLRRLLHLDRLRIEYIDEEWDRARTKLSPKLSVRHGYATGKNATDRMLSKLSGSTLQGHTHRLSLLYRTEHNDDEDDDPVSTRVGGEAGCACEIPGGLGYVAGGEADWQNGALSVYVHSDGDFTVAPLVYVPGRLLCPDGKRYLA